MTKEDFETWKTSRLTQDIIGKWVERRRDKEDMMVELAAGCNSTEVLALQSARLAGIIVGYNELIELTWEDLT